MRFGVCREKRLPAQKGVDREASVSPAIEQPTRLPLQEQRQRRLLASSSEKPIHL
jgi:hypothetical protein